MTLSMAEGIVRRIGPPLQGAKFDTMQAVAQQAARCTHATDHCQDNSLRLSYSHAYLTPFSALIHLTVEVLTTYSEI